MATIRIVSCWLKGQLDAKRLCDEQGCEHHVGVGGVEIEGTPLNTTRPTTDLEQPGRWSPSIKEGSALSKGRRASTIRSSLLIEARNFRIEKQGDDEAAALKAP